MNPKPRGRRAYSRRALLTLVLLLMFAFTSGLAVVDDVALAVGSATPTNCTVSAATPTAPSIKTCTGTIGGAAFQIRLPATGWNKTLVLYSHGYVTYGSPNPATDVGDPATGAYLLSQGYALAGSSYSTTGWALETAFNDQIGVINYFKANIGHPKRTIAWGHSLGGIITAGLVQKYPDEFDAALPMCGVVGGGVGAWNVALDAEFAFKTLVAPTSALKLVNIGGLAGIGPNIGLATGLLDAAQATSKGKARIALVAAMGSAPGWFQALTPEPAATDYVSRQFNQYLWFRYVTFPFAFGFRADLEIKAGGNPSWNTDVNYRRQLRRSPNRAEVEALYTQAGLSLEDDLRTLEDAPRIEANPASVNYLEKNIVFDGDISIPILTIHTTGDGLVPVENEQAYGKVVREEGNGNYLRQAYIHRAGHCTFTPAEMIAAFKTLVARLDSGRWKESTDPTSLNTLAASLGPLNVYPQGSTLVATPPGYFEYKPSKYQRPYTANDSYDDDDDDE